MLTSKINTKNIFLYTLIAIVAFLVLAALYFNSYKFLGEETLRYTRVNIDKGIDIYDLASKYADNGNKAKFVSETKRINDISYGDFIPGNSTLIIPIIESE